MNPVSRGAGLCAVSLGYGGRRNIKRDDDPLLNWEHVAFRFLRIARSGAYRSALSTVYAPAPDGPVRYSTTRHSRTSPHTRSPAERQKDDRP
jgi:hypothetical protein